MKQFVIAGGLLLTGFYSVALAQQEEKCDTDDVWACCAFFCMANPAGPTAEPKCEPPIKRLHEFWGNNSGFPSCHGFNPQQTLFDPCPAGTTQANGAGYVGLAGPMPPSPLGGYSSGALDQVYVDTSTNDPSAINTEGGLMLQRRICVAGSRGPMMDMDGRTISLFDRVYVQAPQTDKPYLVLVQQPDGSTWSFRTEEP